MHVSVIITTKNEEYNIEECLKSIKHQNYQQENIEIIVIDNNSIDNTRTITLKYTDKVYDYGPERSAQRNFGINKAGGEYILYLDADMRLSQNVISECVAKCQAQGFSALYIPEIIVGSDSWIKVRNFERSFYNATCIDAVRFVRKDIIIQAGGFDESLTGPEDWDFDRRINVLGKVSLIKSPIYHDEGEFNLKKYLQKKNYYSLSFKPYIDKWGQHDKVIKKQLGFWYRFIGVFIEKGKFVKLLSHPVLAFKMYFLRFLVGINYVRCKNIMSTARQDI